VVAGIVIYDRKGTDLEGRWTHEDSKGHFAREVVFGVPKDRFVGSWKVDIYRPNGPLFWTGGLTSDELGEAFSLRWEGAFIESGDASSYIGVGVELPDGTIVATFEDAGV